ncbi:spermatogenesis-associated protein 45 isoform X2 [Lutra lutra]|uniref:spermatogenesis-associated protein 45 isoform X2 n=1 Tax=Lutra lutra TaxID=9657 RepID=UPI001FD45118|nr:spermatogenesis-associated protein 45 isoform X2 [Lutra lutra]
MLEISKSNWQGREVAGIEAYGPGSVGNPLERLHSCVIDETNKLMRKWRTWLCGLDEVWNGTCNSTEVCLDHDQGVLSQGIPGATGEDDSAFQV